MELHGCNQDALIRAVELFVASFFKSYLKLVESTMKQAMKDIWEDLGNLAISKFMMRGSTLRCNLWFDT